MAECEQREQETIPVEDIFDQIRDSMGHTWPVGTFNPKEPLVIEGEYKVVEGEPEGLSNSRELSQKPDNQLPEVING